jgi:glycogen debranching enzyme
MALAKSDARQYSQFRSRKRDHDGSIHAHQSLGAGSNETWMDGKLGDAVCSPRGNRAFEIQGLWFFALKRRAQLGALVQGEGNFKDRINARADRLRQAIRDNYLKIDNAGGSGSRVQLADHLRAEGTLDFKARPNALLVFQLDTQDLLLAAQEKQDIFADLVQKNVFTDFVVRSMGMSVNLELRPERLPGFSRFQVNGRPLQDIRQNPQVMEAGSFLITLF